MQTTASLAGWFERSLAAILQHHGISAARTTRRYLAGLLERFARSESLVASDVGRGVHRPLAQHWAEARRAQTRTSHTRHLRGRGDLALFMCGIFPDYVSTRLTGHAYYLAMGRSAYAELADIAGGAAADTWSELALGFPEFAEALNLAVWGEGRAADALALYERWLAGNGALARKRLAELRIDPLPAPPHVCH